MYILSIDTSTKFLCVVIAKDGRLLSYYNRIHERAHNQLLISVIDKLLKKSSLTVYDLDCLAVDTGPGSFTGIRIGLATVKGLSMVLKIPIVNIPSLDLLAFSLRDKGDLICPIIDAKRGYVYSALYQAASDSLKRQGDYFLGNIEKFLGKTGQKVVFTGDAVSIYRDQIKKIKSSKTIFAKEKFWYPDPLALAQLSFMLYKKKKVKTADELSPLYLYPDTCTVQKK